MAILRNINVARKYKVNPATVGNWIDQAKSGRIDLELTSVRGRTYLEDTEHNHLELQRLKEQGVKFRAKNLNTVVKITPDPKIYEVFNEKQIISLITNIQEYNTIPVKFSYNEEGAKYYYQAIQAEIKISGTNTFLEEKTLNYYVKNFIHSLMKQGKKINLVEIGPDYSAHLIKDVIDYLQENKALNKYISIGMSEEMYKIRKKNLLETHGILPIKYIRDIEEELIRDILYLEKMEDSNVVNVCLYLNSAITNVKNINHLLGNFTESMIGDDRLIINTLLADITKKDFVSKKLNIDVRNNRHKWLIQMLGLEKSITIEAIEVIPVLGSRRVNLILDKTVEIEFLIQNKKFTLKLEQDQKINIFFSKKLLLEDFSPMFVSSNLILEQYNLLSETNNGTFFLKKLTR